MVNFANALADLGWEPQVLTIREQDIAQLDHGRLRGLDRLAIHRARVLPTVDGAYGVAKRAWRARSGSAAGPAAAAHGAGQRQDEPRRETLSRRLRRYVLSFLVLPDRERGWILPATLAAVRRVRDRRIPWIVTSCPPYSTHLIGLGVKTLTGTRWVADFRDPWMTTGSKRLYPTCAVSRAIESWLERKVVERADLVLFNVERLRNAYRSRYRHLSPDKFAFIPNAVAAGPAPETPVAKYDAFTLAYTGSLYLGRSPEPVWHAVSRLIESGTIQPEGIRIKLVGQCRDVDGLPTAELARRYGLESVTEICDPVPYRQAIDIVRRSHVALLFAPNLAYQIPAKAYEYLALGTPILAIAGEGGTADLIRETGAGRAFPPEDVDGIMGFIQQELEASRSRNGRPAGQSLARYDARRLTEELVGHLDRIEALAPETRRHP
jgi:glycosyltransferase involved in cell wall biosynthesis